MVFFAAHTPLRLSGLAPLFPVDCDPNPNPPDDVSSPLLSTYIAPCDESPLGSPHSTTKGIENANTFPPAPAAKP